MEGRCATCRWWTPPDDPAYWGTCGLLACNWKHHPVHAEAKAIPYGEEDPGIFVTAPDFGCVQWEEKPE